ncbi:MAG: hypothetical protein WC992_02330 [Acholeplasmataceae bacterium]|jgi:hypothetical protein
MTNYDLPSIPPFMFIEADKEIGNFRVLAFGAYNAMGLIGTEGAGVVICQQSPPSVVSILTIAYNAPKRLEVFNSIETEEDLRRIIHEEGWQTRFDPFTKPKRRTRPNGHSLRACYGRITSTAENKAEFLYDARLLLQRLDRKLKAFGLRGKVSVNPGGPAVSGEALGYWSYRGGKRRLMVEVSQSCISYGDRDDRVFVMYRLEEVEEGRGTRYGQNFFVTAKLTDAAVLRAVEGLISKMEVPA